MKMKFNFEKKHPVRDFKKNNSPLEQVLIYIILGLIALIFLVTVVAIITKAVSPKTTIWENDPLPSEIESLNKKNGEEMSAFTGLQTIRVTTLADTSENKEATGSILVISPWFSYPKGDTEFYEELSRKRILITSIITYYFSSKTKAQIISEDEAIIKADLTSEINSQLSLGKIGQLYFTEFIFFE